MYYKILESKNADEIGGIVNRDNTTGAYTVFDCLGNSVGSMGTSSMQSRDIGKTWELSPVLGMDRIYLLKEQLNVKILVA